MAAARILGAGSLLLLVVTLYRGPIHFIDFGLATVPALGLDGLLCLMFFVQHSGMVRKTSRDRIGRYVPEHYHGAIYAIASGMALFALLIFWQPTAESMFNATGPLRWLMRGLFAATVLGFVWGVRALGSFDAFGIRPIKASLRGRKLRDLPLKISGPYRWVRHPLYFFVLILLWCYPDLTADRLLLNSAMTIWVAVGTVLEERDLTALFGEPYREYQRKVPMLLPWRVPRRG